MLLITYQKSVMLRLTQWLTITLLVPCSLVHAEDLLDIYHQAQTADSVYQAAKFSLEATSEKIPQARAGLLPAIGITANDNGTHAKSTFTGNPQVTRDIQTWAWTAQLTQPLIRLQSIYAYHESKAQVEQAMAQYTLAEQNLILRVAQAYFDVIVAQEGVLVAEAQQVAMKAQLAQAEHGFKAGTVSVTDVYEAKSHAGSAHAQWVAANNDLEKKKAELEKIVGQPTAKLAILKLGASMARPTPDVQQEWMDQARQNNPAVKAQEAALKVSEAEVKRNRAEYAPTLDLVASYGANSSSGTLVNPNDFATLTRSSQLGVQITIPIFTGGSTTSKVREAIANQSKSDADLETARRQAATDARVAFVGIEGGLSQIEALTSAVESGKAAVKGNQVGYKVGIRINIDVLNTEQQLFAAQRDLAKARYDTLLEGLKLKAAAGILAEQDLIEINQLFGDASLAGNDYMIYGENAFNAGDSEIASADHL